MKNSKSKRTYILAVILLGLLVLAYKVMFVAPTEDINSEANVVSSQQVEIILKEIESINFDTSVMENQNFKSLKSIEIPLPNLPVGRSNPFSVVGAN